MEISAQIAQRTIGAGFFTLFGAAWILSWAVPTFGIASAAVLVTGLAALCLLARCIVQYRRYRGALAALGETPARRRARRVFHIVNIAQWLALIVAANVLAHIGLAQWVVPAAVLIVGLHLFPLAAVFRYGPHHVTGAALVLLAVAYPLLSPGGPGGLSCRLCAGLILWFSAAWALLRPLMRARPVPVP